MASTSQGALLTTTHHKQQLAIRAAALKELLALWPQYQLEDIDAMWPPFETGLMAVIEKYHGLAARRSAIYYSSLRLAEGARDEWTVTPARFDKDNARAGINLLGPIQTKIGLRRGQRAPREVALVRLSGEVTRHVLAGSRDTLIGAADSDPAASGFRRIITGTCAFCRQLAEFGKKVGNFEAHTNCACMPEPAFEKGPALPTAEDLAAFDAAEREAAAAAQRAVSAETVLRGLLALEVARRVLTSSETRITVEGGQQLTLKEYETDGELSRDWLSSRLGRNLSAKVPLGTLAGAGLMVFEHIELPQGQPSDLPAAMATPDGRKLGLFDWLTGQQDRDGNWLFDEATGTVVGINHADSMQDAQARKAGEPALPGDSPFMEVLVELAADAEGLQVTATEITQAELAAAEVAIRGMQIDFEALGMLAEHTEIVTRLKLLQKVAR